MKLSRIPIWFFFFVLLCSFSLWANSETLSPAEPYAGGYFDFSVSSRVFELPLFGNSSPVSFMFLSSHRFRSGADFSAWLDGGYPRTTTGLGFEISRLPTSRGLFNIRGGDLSVRPLSPHNFLLPNSNTIAVQGLGLEYSSSGLQWSVSGGRSKYSVGGPDFVSISRPSIFQAEVLQRLRHNYFGLTLTGIMEPIFILSDTQMVWSGVLTGRFYHQFSPVSLFSGEVLISQQGSTGGSAGFHHNFQTGELGVSGYFLGDDFPYLPPIFRPGEIGVQIGGRYYPGESSTFFGQMNYYLDTLVRNRSDFRGSIGYGWSPGDSRPYIQATYYREQIEFDPLSIEPQLGSETDRFSVSMSQASSGGFSNFRLEHLLGNQTKSRTQAIFDFRKVIYQNSFLNGSFVAQREDESGFGFTGESSIERPWKPKYYYLLGLGAAFRRTFGNDSGEGIARFGLSRRITDSGFRAQLEVSVPFSLGLQRSNLSQWQILFHLGQHFTWNNRQSSTSASFTSTTGEYGSIEGVVRDQKDGMSGLTIMINGEPKTVTGSNGRFKISRVPAGPVTLSIDTRGLDPRISIVGDLVRQVLVVSNQITTVDFIAANLLSFKGAIVCEGGKQRPARGLEISLVGNGGSSTTMTSDVGAFQFDQLSPGAYVLSMKHPASVNTQKEIELVLTQDILSHVIRIDCQDILSPTHVGKFPTDQPVAKELPESSPSRQSHVAKQKPAEGNKQSDPLEKSPVSPPFEQTTAKAASPLHLLQRGKLAEAAAAWQKELDHNQSKYTIQLEIACQESTVHEAVKLVDASNLFVVPLKYRGRSCYRILYGTYTSQESAEAVRSRLPSIFLIQETPAEVVSLRADGKRVEQLTAKSTTPVQLLQSGNLEEAAVAWRKELIRARQKYTIQLVVACEESTVHEVVGVIGTSNLFVVPINFRGRHCYRIVYGAYPSKSSAESARSGLPGIFLNQEAPAMVVSVSKILL